MSSTCALQDSCLQQIDLVRRQTPVCLELATRGLQLEVQGAEHGVSEWLKAFLTPLASDQFPITRRFRTIVTYSDSLLAALVAWHDGAQAAEQTFTFSRRHELFSRICVSDLISVDYYPRVGVAWVTNLEANSVTFVFGSRAELAPVELARGIVELLSRHMRDQGWCVFHAGAVQCDSRNWMLLGDSGAGKTTLLLSLMTAGARCVSNERVWVRAEDGKLQIETFPQAIGVGLGTVEQFETLLPYVERPDRLAFPQHKFNAERVWGTELANRKHLPDKLKMLASEVTDDLDTELPHPDRALAGIIVPQLATESASEPTLQPQEAEELEPLLARNQIRLPMDDVYPAWLPLGFGLEEPDGEACLRLLSQLRGFRLSFNGLPNPNLRFSELF